MPLDNHISVSGNITRSPDLRIGASGVAITKLGLAVNRRVRDGDDWKTEVSFFEVICFRDLASRAAESLAVGDRVTVEGFLQQRRWETEEGESRSTVEIVADDIGASMRFATVDIHKAPKPASATPITTPGENPGELGEEIF